MAADCLASVVGQQQDVKRIFAEVCDLDPEAHKSRLDQLCGSDLRLRLAVERLLQHDVPDSIFEDNWTGDASGRGDWNVSPPDEWIGRTVQSYKILERVGEGGMGVVYRGEDVRLKRHVAIKFLGTHLMGDPRQRRRFIREAQAVAALDHPSICKVFDIGEADGRPYIVSAYIQGDSLEDVIRRGKLPLPTAIKYSIQMAEALQTSHAQGILHRDLKPANVLLATYSGGGSRAMIIDFGLAQISGRSELTAPGLLIGTARYVCPELLQGQPIGPQADVWSLGVMIYEMLTGRTPFDADNRERLFYMICYENPAPLTSISAELPEEADRVIAKTLQRDTNLRHRDMGSLLEDLRALKVQLSAPGIQPAPPIQAEEDRPARLTRRPKFSKRAWVAVTMTAILLVWFGIWIWM
jgi:serine/threonine protein kinase